MSEYLYKYEFYMTIHSLLIILHTSVIIQTISSKISEKSLKESNEIIWITLIFSLFYVLILLDITNCIKLTIFRISTSDSSPVSVI